jgi:hypothetical protein
MSGLANRARGDAILHVEGAPRRLRLTLGALAELETAFQAHSLEALEARLARPSAADLLVILQALLAGAGEPAIDLRAAALDPADAARAVAEAFHAAGGS